MRVLVYTEVEVLLVWNQLGDLRSCPVAAMLLVYVYFDAAKFGDNKSAAEQICIRSQTLRTSDQRARGNLGMCAGIRLSKA